MRKQLVISVTVLSTAFCCGCASPWRPQWQLAAPASPTEASAERMTEASRLFSQADNAERLRWSIRGFDQVLELDPGSYEALVLLGNQYILLGTAYTQERSLKRQHFAEAMKYCELAMYTNPAFRKRVDAGAKPWEAADTLTARETDAMLFWVTALQYDFKEGMNLPAKIANVGWMEYCLHFINRIEEVRPDYGGGAVEFTKTICYFSLPESRGGDRKKAAAYMIKAAEKSPNWLFGRWARGKYYHKIVHNSAARTEDLHWVTQQDLDTVEDPYPWRVHFQQDARSILGIE